MPTASVLKEVIEERETVFVAALVAGGSPGRLQFVTLDWRLAIAAQREGLTLLGSD
jgi:hypothetical protein